MIKSRVIDGETYIDVAEASALVGITEGQLRKMARQSTMPGTPYYGVIKTRKVISRWMFEKKSLVNALGEASDD